MQMYSVKSVNIKSIGYENNAMYVKLNSGVLYSYFGVPYSEFLNCLNSTSQGVYFDSNIKNSYPCTRVG